MEFIHVRALQEWSGDVNKTNNDGVLNNTRDDCSRERDLLIETRVNLPLAVVGIVINCVVIYVWNAETTFQPTTYLFKAMAVADSLSRFFYICFVVNWHLQNFNDIFTHFFSIGLTLL
jgi:hypothetical protein